MPNKSELLSIGETARRSGVAASALRFYESRGLIRSVRGRGNHRRFHRSMLRRIAIIRVAQTLGLSLLEISKALAHLPHQPSPTVKDWEKLSRKWRHDLDKRIEALQDLRDQLSGCIGCGCLSMRKCSLYNKHDHAATTGMGARYLLGNSAEK